jgi:hypothetical protein
MTFKRMQPSNLTARISRQTIIGVVIAAVVLAAGVVTAIAMKGRPPQETTTNEGQAPLVSKGTEPMATENNYVTVNGAGEMVVLNRQTGETRGLTPEEAQRLAEGIKQLVNQDATGLVQVHHKNGTVSMDLQGRFQNVVLAKREADGTITQGCVDNPGDAAAFFDIDPALVGAARRETTQPTSNTLPIR